jgi:hypothetical protein
MLLMDIQLLCSMANSLENLQTKLFITDRDRFIRDFQIDQEENEVLQYCLWHPEAMLIRRITDNHKDKPCSLFTIGLKLEGYGFFNNTFSVRDDIDKLQKDENILKICEYADRCIAHNDKRGCEEI